MHSYLHISGFIATFLSIYLGMHYYLAFWIIRHFPALPVSPSAVRLSFMSAALLMPVSMYWLRNYPCAPARALALAAYVWMGIVFIGLMLAFAGDIMELAGLILKTNLKPLAAKAVPMLLAAAVVIALIQAQLPPKITRLDIPLENLPPELDGLKIGLISDLHLGVGMPPYKLKQICRKVEEIAPDLLVIAGDLSDSGFDYSAQAADIASGIKPPLGKIGILGNHDFYFGLDKSLALYEKCGVKVLRQAKMTIAGKLDIWGIDDIRTAGLSDKDLEAVFSRLQAPGRAVILLSHEPRKFELARKFGAGLMLSGHTHAGQIFPFNFFVRLTNPFVYGLHRYEGGYIYVTSGAGHWGPPMRLFRPSEAALLTLRVPKENIK